MQLRQAVAAHKAPVHTTASPARPQARHTVVTVYRMLPSTAAQKTFPGALL